jgi:hypothetical protein
MKTFNLTKVVNFPTRVAHNKGTLIDFFFLKKDFMKYNSITAYPFENGLSDRDMQVVYLG